MGPFKSDDALRNLQRGIEKTETGMSRAAKVRQVFRLGRPPKTRKPLPPFVALQKAEFLLWDLRTKMGAAKLSPDDVGGKIIAVQPGKPPLSIWLTDRDKALKALSAPGAVALGMVFFQRDWETSADKVHDVVFIVPFMGLTEQELNILKAEVTELLNTVRKVQSGGGN